MLNTPLPDPRAGRDAAGIPSEFVQSALSDPFKFVVLCNLGCYAEEMHRIRELFLHPSLPHPSQWRWEGSKSGAAMYGTSAGSVVLKPECCVFPKIGSVGRADSSGFRRVLPVLLEVQRRGALIEEPIAHFATESGLSFFGTRFRQGTAIDDFLKVASPEERARAATLAGSHLAGLHRKGVCHGHPHDGNWLVSGGAPFLIDGKACTFASDYPHTYKATGRIESFDNACANDRAVALQMFEPMKLQSEFLEGYMRA